MPDDASTNKNVVVGGSLGGAIATVLTWIASQFFGIDLPAQVAAAMAVILIALGGWIGSFKK
jgi:hypothetical protein